MNTLFRETMKQIHEQRYYNKYTGQIILLEIAFSGKDVGCKI
jgi:hypothetical protein